MNHMTAEDGNVIITTANRLDGKFGIKSMIAESAFNTLSTTIKSRYGEEIYLDENNARQALSWIKEHDKKYEMRPKDTSGMLKNTRYIFKLDEGTYCDLSAGSFIDRLDPFTKYGNKDIIKLYIFGKHYKKYIKELDYNIKHSNSNDLYIYNIKGYSDNRDESGVDSIGSVLKRRSIDTLFFNDDVKESIIGHIDNFLANKKIYEEKTLNYKTGILLYGVPGSGKTSLATAIATYYNYNLIVLDLTTFEKLDTATLTGCINADSEKFVILLEDIDTLFPSLDRKDDLDDKTRNIINKMLQFLDSSSSPNDVIFIATTNDISKLDSAILREGRFDIKVEVGNINNKASTEMLESFNIPEEDINEILKEMPKDENGNINPAALQNKAISYFKKALED